MNATKKIIATIAALTATASVALADGHVSNALETAEQELSHAVVVKSVTAAADGWVVIHAIKDGKPVVPASIGHTYVKAGMTETKSSRCCTSMMANSASTNSDPEALRTTSRWLSMAARWSARFRSTTDPFGRALFASPGQIVFLEVQYVEPGTGLREIEKMALDPVGGHSGGRRLRAVCRAL